MEAFQSQIESTQALSEADKKLALFEQAFANHDEYEEFKEYAFDLASPDLQESFVTVYVENKDNPNIVEYFENGLPYDDIGMQDFITKFSTITRKQESENKENYLENKEKDNSTSKELLDKIYKNENYSDIFDVAFQEQSIDITDGISLDEYTQVIESIYPQLLEIAKQGTAQEFVETFEQLEQIQTSLGASFEGFETYRAEYLLIKRSLESDNSESKTTAQETSLGIDTTLPGKAVLENDRLIYGDQIVDLGTKPPTKYIESEGGYELQSGEVDYAESREVKRERVKLEKGITENKNKLTGVESELDLLDQQKDDIASLDLNNEDILDRLFEYYNKFPNKVQNIRSLIEQVDNGTASTEQLRDTLQSYVETRIGTLTLEKETIERQISEQQTRLTEINTQRDAGILAFREKMKEQDERTREILEFLHVTGFDLLPKDFTDQIIAEVKSNSTSITGLSLDRSRIDIANGTFGESPTEEGGDEWKRNLLQFMNKMIYGELNPEHSLIKVDEMISVTGKRIDPTEFNIMLEEQGIKSDLGFNIVKARENLEK
ncbi:hypothetical protein MK079_01285 [Candidatus Gracilibacteria bacterium]|nr:hypothetical protein [Candidatus Gracilibacteria bacterium]